MIKKTILEQYRGINKNFMTPKVTSAITTPDNRIIEISTGYDMNDKQIWGVSEFILNDDGKIETTRRGAMHTSRLSANKHAHILNGAM